MNRIALLGSVAASFELVGCIVKPPVKEAQTLSNITQLTSDFARAGEAYFSADGKYIVFQAVPPWEEQYQMYVAAVHETLEKKLRIDDVIHVSIGTPVKISPIRSRNTCGFFSPDGRSLLFASTAGKDDPNEGTPGYQRKTGNYRWEFSPGMEIYRADGWQKAIATANRSSTTRPSLDFARNALTDNNAYDAECSFSPDGKWIVFCSNRDGDAELYAMRADGKRPVRLTHTRGYDGGPFVSPDGKRLVYRSDRAGNDLLQIYVADLVFDANGDVSGLTNEKRLTPGANVNWGPFWHPSGKYLIYASSAEGHSNYELFMMRADGTRNCHITFSPGFDGLPAFNADGSRLMWSSKRAPDGSTQVFVADFDLPDYLKW